jgi:hypothetical protein
MIVGASFVVHEVADRSVDPAWITAVSLVSLGVVALAVTLLRRPAEPDAFDGLDELDVPAVAAEPDE